MLERSLVVLAAATLSIAAIATTTPARADPSAPSSASATSTVVERQDGKDWTFSFTDNLLTGGDADPHIPMIRERGAHAIRVTLIRPRTQFVSALLESVEAL